MARTTHNMMPHRGKVGFGTHMAHNLAAQFKTDSQERQVRKVADVWKKDVWEFQAKSGSSGSCRLFLRFLGKSQFEKRLGEHLEVPDILLADIRGLLTSSIAQEGIARSSLFSVGFRTYTQILRDALGLAKA